MNDEMLEGLIRSSLQQRAPREMPASLALRAAAIPRQSASTATERRRLPHRRAGWLAILAPVAVALVVAGVVLVPNVVAPPATGSRPVPTLPPVTQPSLPPAADTPALLVAGAWTGADTGWVVDAGNGLWITADGGQTWAGPRQLPKPFDELRGGPAFSDGENGAAVWTTQAANGAEVWVYRTTDGGSTWSSSRVGTLSSNAESKVSATVHFSDVKNGIVLAAAYATGPVPEGHAGSGLVPTACAGWATTDGGASWASLPNAPCSDHDAWASPSVGILMSAADGGPKVSTTLDGGRTWRTGNLPGVTADDAPFEVTFTVAADGSPLLAYWVNHAGAATASPTQVTVAQSADGGATWAKSYEFAPPGALDVDSVSVVGPDHWIGTGSVARLTSPGQPDVPVYESGDAGRTWSETGTLGPIDGRTFGWSDRLHGMATGLDDSGCDLPSGTPCHDDGFFLTNDGGRTWHEVPF